jgi:glutathione-regulated potassium-efflux system ancillary protein KefC
MHGVLWIALVFLAAAVLVVPVSQRLGFGTVLGYLAAGVVIGPSGFAFVTNVHDIMHFSEFGVALLLFLIGLELDPRRLWEKRFTIFGLGSAQVLGTLAVFAGVAYAAGLSARLALLAGMAFSLSSTAMVLQILGERKAMNSDAGRKAFAVLLFQDLAVIPMLALLPLLGGGASSRPASAGLVLAVIAATLVLGRLFLRRALRLIAGLHVRELFTALSLLLVVGMAFVMQSIGASMALGAFLAGLLLADSEYKHALETDIEPFKGLLLGLFFISVGMSVQLREVMAAPGVVFGVVILLLVLKTAIHAGLGRIFGLAAGQVPFFSLVLAQVGEFAFVLFDAALGLGVVNEHERQVLVAISAVSIFATPLVLKAYDLLLAPRLEGTRREQDTVEHDGAPVIIAGFGRVGQIVGRYLFANGIRATVLDFEAGLVDSLRRFGFKVFYGDATRLDLLTTAGAGHAKVLVVAIDDVEANLRLVDLAQRHFPGLKIVCRARNVDHVFELRSRGVEILERETFDGALRLGRHVLETLGSDRHQAYLLAQKFRAFDQHLTDELAKERESIKVRISKAKQARQDIERLFAEEEERLRFGDEGWGSPRAAKQGAEAAEDAASPLAP